MATAKQREAARKNVKKAQAGAQKKQTLKNLDAKTRTAWGKEAAAVRRGDEPTRKELEAEARRLGIEGRSKMGKAELKRAVARAKERPSDPGLRARVELPHEVRPRLREQLGRVAVAALRERLGVVGPGRPPAGAHR